VKIVYSKSIPNVSFWLMLSLLLAAASLAACAMPGVPTPGAIEAETAPAVEAPAALASQGSAASMEPAERNNMFSAAPEMAIDPSKYYFATLKTERGDIKIQLFADRSPMTVNNFVFLAREGFYDNTTFHRVLEDFMAQAGDPTGTGTGGPGYTFADEFWPGATFDRRGLLAMANAGPGTNGSQFFITFAPTPWLDGGHTIFGEVIEGDEVLAQITLRDPMANPDEPGDLIETIVIEEGDSSILPTPTPLPPTPTPFPPTNLEGDRPLADLPGEEKVNYFNAEPAMVIDTTKSFTAIISTSQGDLVVSLLDDEAPVAVNNFVVLANLGFYDNTPINDVNPDLLVVIGAPDNDPGGDVGYVFKPEAGLPGDPEAGAIAYRTLSQDIDGSIIASGSQLFLAIAPPPPDVNDVYSFFGKIVEGLEILPNLTTEDAILSITIVEE
jgi:cyclophilin family peptidyl-prolyl cis-trans isomerase